MEWPIITIIVIAAAGGFLLIGLMLPRRHVATESIDIIAPRERVWVVATDYHQQPRWHPEIEAVEPLPDRNTHPCWAEVRKGGSRKVIEEIQRDAPQRLVWRFHDSHWAYNTRWEIRFIDEGRHTRVEASQYADFRAFYARWFGLLIGRVSTLKLYLGALKDACESPEDSPGGHDDAATPDA